MVTISHIQEFVDSVQKELLAHRRWFHQHPELSYQEVRTKAYIVDYLGSLKAGKVVETAKTGVIYELGNGYPLIAFRFNMDGLPISENSTHACKSKFAGYSHACGHDFELSWGLLLAKYFASHGVEGSIRLVFQPAEEGPGNDDMQRTGGELLSELGWFDVDGVFSLHVDPELSVGEVGIAAGLVTCSAYDFVYKLTGVSGHAAKPLSFTNPIPQAAVILEQIRRLENELNQLRKKDEVVIITPTVLTSNVNVELEDFEETQNTVPSSVLIKGITRVRSNQLEPRLIEGLNRIVESNNSDISLDLRIKKRAPATNNNIEMVKAVTKAVETNGFTKVNKLTTWRDDAGWVSERAKCAHGFIGVKSDSESKLHSANFHPDESGLRVGLSVFLNSFEIYKSQFK